MLVLLGLSLSSLSVFVCSLYQHTFVQSLQARSTPDDQRQREGKATQNSPPRDVDQKRFALRDLRDDVLRRVRGFRGDDGGSNESGGSDGGLFDTFRCSRYRLRKRRIFR